MTGILGRQAFLLYPALVIIYKSQGTLQDLWKKTEKLQKPL